ncbi:EexN family lipoprotein [Enterovibrio calviensis]|uniref:EexN family lipoprotein n=1 Tax=Enterovibrio calviensis TaxID=91359 RepID=UPI000481FD25|nr:EexN family lipoprotein [Enterovibrio calviensis]
MKKLVCISALVALISACSEEELTRDKQWYMENPEQMTLKVAECDNDANLATSQNCKNALKAKQKLLLNKWKNG